MRGSKGQTRLHAALTRDTCAGVEEGGAGALHSVLDMWGPQPTPPPCQNRMPHKPGGSGQPHGGRSLDEKVGPGQALGGQGLRQTEGGVEA